jgi:hypothetical protein
MVKLLKELNDFSYDHEEVKKSQAAGGPLIVTGVLQRADVINQNGRIYPRHVLEPQIQAYSVLVKERRAMGELDHCLLSDNKVLCSTGWKNIQDLNNNEEIFTLNTITNRIEKQTIKRKIVVDYNGKMYRFSNGKTFSMEISPNHNVLLWDRYDNPYKITAQQLKEGLEKNDSIINHSCIKHNFTYEPINPKTHFTIPNTKITLPINDWAALFGIWIAEGHVDGSSGGKIKNRISITQKKENFV